MTSAKPDSPQVLRIIDANLNRVGEGLRILEDLARLLLNDAALSEQLKVMRHELIRGSASFQQRLVQWRDAESDVGVNTQVPGEEKERELALVLVANARRVQESLRTLEETTKVSGISQELDSEKFKQARFELYSLEKKLLSRLLRQDKVKRVTGLYAVIDTQALQGRSHVEVTRQIVRGGARIIQLRDKVLSRKELLPIAQQLKDFCAAQNVLFIMNDYLDLAMAVAADGLHLGQDDLPFKVARKLLPIDMLLGCSVITAAQAIAAQAEGADYVAPGAIYPTLSKESVNVVGLEVVRAVRQAVSVPVVAIGGITKENAAEVTAAGADAVAVISAILAAESPEEATRQIINSLEARK